MVTMFEYVRTGVDCKEAACVLSHYSIHLLNQYLIVYNTAQQSNRGIHNFEPFELLMLQGYIIAIEVVLVKPLLLHKAHAS